MKRYTFRIDEKEDRDITDLLDSIPKPLRGMYIKFALRLGINREKDKDILALPNLCEPYFRFELVKEGLRHLIKAQGQPQTLATPVNELQAFGTED
ncbi:MAG: hypothetical protein M0P16_00260 [Syntrophales bacterium]|jgi:hypothetical protein|nr:hypothetical protein [Syntrophales bacterium]